MLNRPKNPALLYRWSEDRTTMNCVEIEYYLMDVSDHGRISIVCLAKKSSFNPNDVVSYVQVG